MAKRFTDTTKWKRPWFRSLNVHAKLVWQYLCDECDHVGIWLADFELISFQVGFKVDEEKLATWLGDKLVKIDKDKYFIPSFFEFQYGSAKEGFKAKISAINELRAYGLIEELGDSLVDLTNSYLSVQGLSMDCPSIGIGKSIGKSNKGGVGENVSPDDLEAVYQEYPRKEGKKAGLKIAAAQIKTREDLEALKTAVDHYRSNLKRKGTSAEFVKYFSTFMGEWKDWLDPTHGTAEDFSDKPERVRPMAEILADEAGGSL